MASTEPPTSDASVRSPRLLLVDDDPIVRRAIRRLLQGGRPGWQIDVAESREGALQLLKIKTYDVVVTDLHMPALEGVALLRGLKMQQPTVMRVIHSSHVESLSREQLEDLSHAVIAKPGRPDELVMVLDWALEQRRRKIRDCVGS
ncbi:MAG TPA: response regulator [Polyangiaceae bacterium]|nr:response regulator [Polyangiaceae bacterium]